METNDAQKGVVVNCLWTFVYERPDIYSNVLSSFRMLDEIEVLKNYLEDPVFYAVYYSDKKIGYCFKDHIILKESD